MSFDAARLYSLLPAIYRIRDDAEGKPLEALITVLAEQAEVLEENLEQLYDDQFIETCAEWVVPYIGDLIGYRPLYSKTAEYLSARAEVANTIRYRRRKGTATMLEQLARDVTGWPARVVEFFQLLATTQFMNHIRPGHHYAPDLRDWARLEQLGTAFDTVAHTVDVRRIATDQGRQNIPNVGIFLWRLKACSLKGSPAVALDDRRLFFSPLKHNMPLFTRPEPETDITHLAEPLNVPNPISRRVLDADLVSAEAEDLEPLYYGEDKSLFLWVNGEEIDFRQVKVCDLSDVGDGSSWAHAPVDRIAIDPVLARIALPPNERQRLRISGHASGQYSLTFDGQPAALAHNASPAEIRAALEDLDNLDPGDITVDGVVSDAEVDVVISFAGARAGQDVPLIAVDTAGLTPDATATVAVETQAMAGAAVDVVFHYGFPAELGGGEYEHRASFDKKLEDFEPVVVDASGAAIAPIQNAIDTLTGNGVVEISDSGRYEETLQIDIGPDTRIEIRAANEKRPTLVLNEELKITSGEDGIVTLNGLLITKGPIVVPQAGNELTLLRLRHCTLVPGLELDIDGSPKFPERVSLVVESQRIKIEIEDCIVGPLRVAEGAEVEIRNSIVDATDESRVAFAGVDGNSEGGLLEIENSTVIGRVHTHMTKLASNTIFHAVAVAAEDLNGGEGGDEEGSGDKWLSPVQSTRKQAGCVRFSYVPPGSRLPRRYRCQPELAVAKAVRVAERDGPLSPGAKAELIIAVQARIQPSFRDTRYGQPAYTQLALSCPVEIRRGADDESEMGVYHNLFQPQRETNLRLRLDEYLRFGLEAGIFYAN